VSTYKHCITISDDGFVLLFDLVTFAKIRQSTLLLVLCIAKKFDLCKKLHCPLIPSSGSVNIVEWGLYKGLITPDQMYAAHEDENKKEQGDEQVKEKDSHELSEAQIKVSECRTNPLLNYITV